MPIEAATINDVLHGIMEHVYACLDNTTLGQPKDKFLSFTRPPDDCCDYLAVWFEDLLPTVNFPAVFDGEDDCGVVQRMMEVKLKLVRPCWPILKDNANSPFPAPSEIAAAAENLTIDANVLWCCLSDGFNGSDVWPEGDSLCLGSKLQSLRPDKPRGGCAGMTATVWVELEGCCND